MMIKENREYNAKATPSTRELQVLKAHFPEYFSPSGEFLIDKFTKNLKESNASISKEGYELKFLGKSYARYESSTKTETFIAPHAEENEKEVNKNSENLYIIGDNLDALKHLLGSYSKKIKCIYIDPPYNTGTDGFVYPDKFEFSAEKLSEILSIDLSEAQRIIALQGKSSHSAWLTFMYPRLILARELLTDDGVIFISIDDNEQANLKLMCDEIFGEENLLSIITTVNNLKGRSDDKFFATSNEYLLSYAKKIDNANIKGFKANENYLKEFNKQDNTSRYKEVSLKKTGKNSLREDRPNMYYPIYYNEKTNQIELEKLNDDFVEILPKIKGKEGCWRWGKKTFLENKDTEIVIKYVNDEYNVYVKMRDLVNSEQRTIKPKTTWINPEYDTGNASKEVEKLIGSKDFFETPKPSKYIKDILEISTYSDSIILDFFSGSATTAHAVMQLNAENGGNRKYIMVQLPEVIKSDKPAYSAGYKSIDEIGRERIRRAAKKIKEETGANIDYGFKTYSLESLSEEDISKLEEFDPEKKIFPAHLLSLYSNAYSSPTEALLSTYLSLDGYGLTESAQPYPIGTYTAYLKESSLYILEAGLKSEELKMLITQIENGSLNIGRIVVYSPSIDFQIGHELQKNLAILSNNKDVKLIQRY